jgi:SAM-dependent methyltransferase
VIAAVAARWLPRRLIRGLRNGYLALLDARDRVTGRMEDLTPPRALHFVGGGDFRAIGKTYLEHFKKQAGLEPFHRVLDIGCGTGRMAVPLLDHLDARGSYVGFDLSGGAIDWCSRHISVRNRRFRFEHADIYNLEYNPRGAIRAERYRFPAEDKSIDFAFATSVFTHIHSLEARHYLTELRRVLSPGGAGLLTFFLFDESMHARPAGPWPAMDFRYRLADGFTIDPRTPERAIAYPEAWLRDSLEAAQLMLDGPIRHGSWWGRPDALDFQDMIVVRRQI